MTADLTDEDRGKTVVHAGEPVGTITEVRDGVAAVDVDFERVPERLRARLGWWEGDRPHALAPGAVAAVTDGEVRLRAERR